MNRPIHFEIVAQDPERASKFYQDVFGWTITKWDGPVDYRIVTTGDEGTPGINGGIIQTKDPSAPGLCVSVIDVADLHASLAAAKAAGGTQVVDPMTVPGVGELAYIKDTEGIVVGLLQPSMGAQPPS